MISSHFYLLFVEQRTTCPSMWLGHMIQWLSCDMLYLYSDRMRARYAVVQTRIYRAVDPLGNDLQAEPCLAFEYVR